MPSEHVQDVHSRHDGSDSGTSTPEQDINSPSSASSPSSPTNNDGSDSGTLGVFDAKSQKKKRKKKGSRNDFLGTQKKQATKNVPEDNIVHTVPNETSKRTAMTKRVAEQYATKNWPVRCCFTNFTTDIQNSHLVPVNPPKWFRDDFRRTNNNANWGQSWKTYVKKHYQTTFTDETWPRNGLINELMA